MKMYKTALLVSSFPSGVIANQADIPVIPEAVFTGKSMNARWATYQTNFAALPKKNRPQFQGVYRAVSNSLFAYFEALKESPVNEVKMNEVKSVFNKAELEYRTELGKIDDGTLLKNLDDALEVAERRTANAVEEASTLELKATTVKADTAADIEAALEAKKIKTKAVEVAAETAETASTNSFRGAGKVIGGVWTSIKNFLGMIWTFIKSFF